MAHAALNGNWRPFSVGKDGFLMVFTRWFSWSRSTPAARGVKQNHQCISVAILLGYHM